MFSGPSGGPLGAPPNPLRPDASEGPFLLSGGPGPPWPPRNSTTGCENRLNGYRFTSLFITKVRIGSYVEKMISREISLQRRVLKVLYVSYVALTVSLTRLCQN